MTSTIFNSARELNAASARVAEIKYSDPVFVNTVTLADRHLDELVAAAKANGTHSTLRICGLARRGDMTARLAAADLFNGLKA